MKYRNHYCMPKYSEGEGVYYGNVEGAPKIPLIEAKSIDDFERLFHQAVDDYLDRSERSRSRTRWGLIFSLLVVIGILVAMVLTCPKKEQHVDALTEKATYLISDAAGMEEDIKIIGAMIGGAVSKQVINAYLIVDDYVVLSIGRFEYKGEENTVSVGAFGHVFTVSKKELKRRMEQSEGSQELKNLFK